MHCALRHEHTVDNSTSLKQGLLPKNWSPRPAGVLQNPVVFAFDKAFSDKTLYKAGENASQVHPILPTNRCPLVYPASYLDFRCFQKRGSSLSVLSGPTTRQHYK